MTPRKLLFRFFPKAGVLMLYFIRYGKFCRLRNPRNIYEKLIWLNFHDRNPLKKRCADKLLVREYLKEKGFGRYLNEIHDVITEPDDIDISRYPDAFVLKCTHGSCFNIFCTDRKTFNLHESAVFMKKWLKLDFSNLYGELHYRGIEPRILCEKHLGSDFMEYKTYCFHGKPEYIMLCLDGENGSKEWYLYDFDWNFIPFLKTDPPEPGYGPPDNLSEIRDFCSRISEDFIFVRVDFYLNEGKIIFGELTFTPSGFIDLDTTEEINHIMGNLIDLPS